MQNKTRVVLTGGGTAGHIIPTHEVRKALEKEILAKFLYIGAYKSMEEKMAKEQEVPFKSISTGKLRRYFSFQNFIDPFRVIIGFIQSIFILSKFKADIVFSKGGFVSVPVAFAAFILRIPIVIHESDVIPGLANKMISKISKRTCVSFEKTKKYLPKSIYTGSPVREELKAKDREEESQLIKDAYKFTKFDNSKPVILVLGGSTGAAPLTNSIYEIIPALEDKAQIILQTGKGKMNESYNACRYLRQYEYIKDELKSLYQIADIVVTRAGANVIFELALLGKASILVPLGKEGSRGDQIINASILQEKEACLVYNDNEDSKRLLRDISKLMRDPSYRRHLERNIEEFSPKGSANNIAKIIKELIV